MVDLRLNLQPAWSLSTEVVIHFGKICCLKRNARCLSGFQVASHLFHVSQCSRRRCRHRSRQTFHKFYKITSVLGQIGMSHDARPVSYGSCRSNGGCRLLNVISPSSNLNPYQHNDFFPDSMLQVAQNQTKMSCVWFDLDVALPVLIFADKAMRLGKCADPKLWDVRIELLLRALSVTASRVIA